MRQDNAPRAQAAWVLAGLSAPVALTLAGLSWHWALLGGALAALYYYIVCRACLAPLPRTMRLAFGRGGAGAVLALTFVWTVFAAGAAAAGADMAYPEDELSWLAPACMLALAAAGGWHGTRTLRRAAGALSLVLGLLYTALLLTAAGQVELRWCRPWGGAAQAAQAFFALLAASAALYLPTAGERVKRPGLLCAAAALVPAVCACVTSGCLSPAVVQRTAAPFYAMSRSLSVLHVIERFEPIVSAALLTGFFCLVSLLTQSAAEIAAALCPHVPVRWCAVGACALAGAAIPLTKLVTKELQAILAGIFWGFFPLLTLGVVAIKKGRKNAKKRVDKPDLL